MKKLNFIGIGGATNIELGGNCCYLKDKGSKKFKLRMWTADTYELTATTSIFSAKIDVNVK